MPELADDPLLLLPSDVRSTRHAAAGTLAPAEALIDDILREAAGNDLLSASTQAALSTVGSPNPTGNPRN